MKTILKNLPGIIISMASFIIIGCMDLIALLILLGIKAIRSISIWILAAFSDGDTTDEVKVTKNMNNYIPIHSQST